ncbi:MAG: (Na+)-NQR maturation NqrM [Gammaproteobacteria bacterium]|nr:(Na+)-NQR maturation NqrM [Gammaproteobacteria bacterium]MDH5304256.1 (Na+)-NQR maturation NqrM [Gammaproteobacteria bacterium]MDH5321449.1 (Na+)-NQR maturation NqrM [Gammaproteobacteria bacterium]
MTLLITLLLAFIIISAMLALMSIGVIAGRKPIKGSCGGINGQGCELCSDACRDRPTRNI